MQLFFYKEEEEAIKFSSLNNLNLNKNKKC